MISEEEHLQLNEMLKSFKERKDIVSKESKNAEIYPIDNDLLVCRCGAHASMGIPSRHRHEKKLVILKKTKPNATLADIVQFHQFEVKCNKKCKYKKSVYFDAINKKIENLIKKLHITEEHFLSYLEYAKGQLDKKFHNNDEERQAAQLRFNILKNKKRKHIEEWKGGAGLGKEELKMYHDGKSIIETQMQAQKKEIEKIETREDVEIFEFETIMKFMKNALKYYQKADNVRKKKITKLLLSNIVISKGKVLKINPKPELESLFILSGRARDTILEPIIEYVIKGLMPIKKISLLLKEVPATLMENRYYSPKILY